jgi:hypothetical protein
VDPPQTVHYRIDREDRLVELNAGWLTFAADNGGQALQPSAVIGQPLWMFVADSTTRQLYEAMVLRLRQGGLPVRFRFRCDAPSRRRLLAMEMTADSVGGVRFCVSSVVEEPRSPVLLLEPDHAREAGSLLTMCGWCKDVRLPAGEWVESEEAIRALGLFGGAPLPRVTHGMCPPCYSAIVGALDDPGTGAAGTISLGRLSAA